MLHQLEADPKAPVIAANPEARVIKHAPARPTDQDKDKDQT
jgi:hypothetical protein